MASGFLEIMKTVSMEASENSQLCDLRFGTVVSESPLKVQISSQLTIPASMLIVPRHLTDYETECTIDWQTENTTHTHTIKDSYSGGGTAENNTHKHAVKGKKKIIIHEALKQGNKVALLRKSGGQSYYILDRVE